MPTYKTGYRSFRYFDAKFEQFPVNLGRTPSVVGFYHLEHEGLNFPIEGWPSALVAAGFASPVELEGSPVPSYHRIRLNNHNRVTPTRPNTRQNHPKQSIALLELRTILLPLEHDELMTQSDVLSGQVYDDIEFGGEPTTAGFDVL